MDNLRGVFANGKVVAGKYSLVKTAKNVSHSQNKHTKRAKFSNTRHLYSYVLVEVDAFSGMTSAFVQIAAAQHFKTSIFISTVNFDEAFSPGRGEKYKFSFVCNAIPTTWYIAKFKFCESRPLKRTRANINKGENTKRRVQQWQNSRSTNLRDGTFVVMLKRL